MVARSSRVYAGNQGRSTASWSVAGRGGKLPCESSWGRRTAGAVPTLRQGWRFLPSGGPAVGLHGGVGNGTTRDVDLKALESAVRQLQALSIRDTRPDRKSHKKDKKDKKKKKKKGHHHKKERKKKKRDSSSSTTSSRSRSRSTSNSSSSSSSGSSGKKLLRWKDKGKDKRVSYDDLSHVDGLKWKKKGDLVAFASKHPGALTAPFLGGSLRQVVQGDPITVISAEGCLSGSLGSPVHRIERGPRLEGDPRREIERAMDILCQRILAIQAAKMKGGSWEKAEAIELVSTQKSLASSSMLALTNA